MKKSVKETFHVLCFSKGCNLFHGLMLISINKLSFLHLSFHFPCSFSRSSIIFFTHTSIQSLNSNTWTIQIYTLRHHCRDHWKEDVSGNRSNTLTNNLTNCLLHASSSHCRRLCRCKAIFEGKWENKNMIMIKLRDIG